MSKTILVTGAAGFIGSHVAEELLQRGDRVVGIDNFNTYYDPVQKRSNLSALQQIAGASSRLNFVEGDFRDVELVRRIFEATSFDGIVHLGAMAGVRPSIEQPALYYDVNVLGTLRLLEAAVRQSMKPTFVFASTSSAYGASTRIPFVEDDPCNGPLAPYAATKRAGELLGYSFHHNFKIPFTALRFFTVYGPRNRPDMMAFKVVDSIVSGRNVPLFNNGEMYRDWTYVRDISQGVVRAVDRPLGFQVMNIGRGEPVSLSAFISCIESLAGKKANLTPAPAPDTDMISTHADITRARTSLGYEPTTSVPEGVEHLWRWHRATYGSK